MLAGILLGPATPGPVLIEHPEDLALLAALRLVLLLFSLGVATDVPDRWGGPLLRRFGEQHGTAHFAETGHPLMRSLEPGEDWWYCFEDRVLVRQPTGQNRQASSAGDGESARDGDDDRAGGAVVQATPPLVHDQRRDHQGE